MQSFSQDEQGFDLKQDYCGGWWKTRNWDSDSYSVWEGYLVISNNDGTMVQE